MKLRAVTYDDDQDIETVTVTMSLREATAIHAIASAMNGHAHRRLHLEGDDSLYEALSALFCGHYDDGTPPGAPHVHLASLNDVPQ